VRLRFAADARSPIDHGKVRLLRASGVINFLPDDAPDARYANVGLAVHARLQLEINPYG
jgi:hypothetical protein